MPPTSPCCSGTQAQHPAACRRAAPVRIGRTAAQACAPTPRRTLLPGPARRGRTAVAAAPESAASLPPCPGDTPCVDAAAASAAPPHPPALCPAGLARADKEAVLGTGAHGCVVWFTGLSGAGKSAVAGAVEAALARRGIATARLDGDCLRTGLCAGLGFSPADRAENVRRAGEAALLAAEAGLVALTALVSPYRAGREGVRARCAAAPGGGIPFIEVYVAAPLAVCEARDAKGLYAAARAGKLPGLTGVCPDAPYEAPAGAEVVLGGEGEVGAAARSVVAFLEGAGLVPREAKGATRPTPKRPRAKSDDPPCGRPVRSGSGLGEEGTVSAAVAVSPDAVQTKRFLSESLATEVRRLRVASGALLCAHPSDIDMAGGMAATPAPGTAEPAAAALNAGAPPTGSPAAVATAADLPPPFASPSRVFDPFARGPGGAQPSTAGRLGGGIPTANQPTRSPAGGRRTGGRRRGLRGGRGGGAASSPSSPLPLPPLGALALTSTTAGPACRWLGGSSVGAQPANAACGAGPPASPSDEVCGGGPGGDPAAATGGLDLRRTAMMRALLQRADGAGGGACGGAAAAAAAPPPARAPGAPATRARRFDPAAAGGGGLLAARFAALGGGGGDAGVALQQQGGDVTLPPPAPPRMSWPPRG